jgi:hypothetical protein
MNEQPTVRARYAPLGRSDFHARIPRGFGRNATAIDPLVDRGLTTTTYMSAFDDPGEKAAVGQVPHDELTEIESYLLYCDHELRLHLHAIAWSVSK